MFGISDNVSYPWSAPWDHVDALCDAASTQCLCHWSFSLYFRLL